MLFIGICVIGVVIVISVGIYMAAGSPGYETRQEHFQRIDKEIAQLQAQVTELQKENR